MKSQRIELAIIHGIRFILVTPDKSNTDKYPLYCIEYFYNGRQYKVKEGIKANGVPSKSYKIEWEMIGFAYDDSSDNSNDEIEDFDSMDAEYQENAH